MQQHEQHEAKAAQRQRAGNVRTGLILASIAIAFFVGFVVKTVWLS